MQTGRLLSRWVPVVGWMVLIFAGSTDVLSAERTSRLLIPLLLRLDPHLSLATVLTIHTALRKLGHVVAYAVLAALLWRALRGQAAFLLKAWAPIGLAFVLAVSYATIDEFHQSFVPSRTASARDVAIDIGGVMIGLAICSAFGLRRKPQIIY